MDQIDVSYLHMILNSQDNTTSEIDEILSLTDYDVRIDFWITDQGQLFLGTESPHIPVEEKWLEQNANRLWIQCKTVAALEFLFERPENEYNYFWKDGNNTIVLTSLGYIWVDSGHQSVKNSIAFLPEKNDDDISQCFGVCTNVPKKYREEEEV